MNIETWKSYLLLFCMFVLAILFFFCIIRAIKGPRYSDRLIANNVICTTGVIFICILSVYLKEAALVDIALIYTLLSCLSGVVVCHVITLHHKGRLLNLKRKEKEL
ncbi:MAG: monovalent cation/H+ antiporter complex subunit F [Erysipelotrichaceae bacterium]|nr:monovalent cation/H+ antiporter complex subunit F [Erysipelotrichaceae bacterium]